MKYGLFCAMIKDEIARNTFFENVIGENSPVFS